MGDVQAIADRVEIEALRGEFTDAVMTHDYDRGASLFTHDGAVRIPASTSSPSAPSEEAVGVWRLGGNGLTEIPQLDDLPILESEQMHRGDAEVAGLEDDMRMNRDQVAVAHGVLDRQLLVGELLVVLLHAGLESVEAGGEVRAVMFACQRDEPLVCVIDAS